MVNVISCDTGNMTTIVAGKKGIASARSFMGRKSTHTNNQVGMSSAFALAEADMTIEYGGETYFIGEGSSMKGTATNTVGVHRLLSPGGETRIFFFAAITEYIKEYGKMPGDWHLALCVPYAVAREGIKEQCNEYFCGEWEWIADGEQYKIRIVDTNPIPQPDAAVMKYAVKPNGKMDTSLLKILKQGHILCGSIGGGTLERFRTFGGVVDEDLTGSLQNRGAVYAMNLVSKDPKMREQLDRMMRTGEFKEDYPDALRQWATEVNGFYSEWTDDIINMAQFKLFFGGGVLALNGHFTPNYESFIIPDDPINVCAEGGYLWLNAIKNPAK